MLSPLIPPQSTISPTDIMQPYPTPTTAPLTCSSPSYVKAWMFRAYTSPFGQYDIIALANRLFRQEH